MKNFKASFLKTAWKWQYSKDVEPTFFRIGVRIGLGLMCIFVAIVLILSTLF